MDNFEAHFAVEPIAIDDLRQAASVTGSRFDLPPANTKRWVIRRKAVVVAAVRSGALSLEEVCERYGISMEEFLGWQRMIDSYGVPGLRVTRLQHYRGAPPIRR